MSELRDYLEEDLGFLKDDITTSVYRRMAESGFARANRIEQAIKHYSSVDDIFSAKLDILKRQYLEEELNDKEQVSKLLRGGKVDEKKWDEKRKKRFEKYYARRLNLLFESIFRIDYMSFKTHALELRAVKKSSDELGKELRKKFGKRPRGMFRGFYDS